MFRNKYGTVHVNLVLITVASKKGADDLAASLSQKRSSQFVNQALAVCKAKYCV